tara:strand:- start:222 stop:776 length:555 start_codon:yes stop_codon:yes gene_type:complete
VDATVEPKERLIPCALSESKNLRSGLTNRPYDMIFHPLCCVRFFKDWRLNGSMTPDAGALELAKRILKSRGLLLEGNEAGILRMEEALVIAADANPSIIIDIEYGGRDSSNQLMISPFGGHGGIIGGSEPDIEDIVWLPGDVELQIQNLFSSIVSLASAGYPGCIGCIDEEPWSEREWRAVVKN